jgi:hypothetical protein
VFSRRQAVRGGLATLLLPGVVGGFLPEAVGSVAQALTLPTSAARPLSIGYLEGSEEASLKRLPWEVQGGRLRGQRVVPAASLWSGDTRLSGETVRVRVYGLFPSNPIGNAEPLESATFAIRYQQQDDPLGPSELDHLAWGVRRWPFSRGNRLEVWVPIGVNGELELIVEVATQEPATRAATRAAIRVVGAEAAGKLGAAASTVDRYTANFTIDGVNGQPKLQRGIYFLGLGTGAWDQEVELPTAKEAAARAGELRSVIIAVDNALGQEAWR